MAPTRRTALQALGTTAFGVLTGCATTMPPRADGGGPRVTLVSVARPDEFPVRPSVEVTRATSTDDHPPQLRTTLANVTDGSVAVGESRSAHFEYTPDESRTSLLLPHGPDEQYPTDLGCWRLTGEVGASADFQTHEIPPGESTTRLVDCYGFEGDEETCLPTGRTGSRRRWRCSPRRGSTGAGLRGGDSRYGSCEEGFSA